MEAHIINTVVLISGRCVLLTEFVNILLSVVAVISSLGAGCSLQIIS